MAGKSILSTLNGWDVIFNKVHSDVFLCVCVCVCGSVLGLYKLKGVGMNMLNFQFLKFLSPRPHSGPSVHYESILSQNVVDSIMCHYTVFYSSLHILQILLLKTFQSWSVRAQKDEWNWKLNWLSVGQWNHAWISSNPDFWDLLKGGGLGELWTECCLRKGGLCWVPTVLELQASCGSSCWPTCFCPENNWFEQ